MYLRSFSSVPWDYTTYNPAAGVLKCPTVVKLLGHFVGLLLKICFVTSSF